MPLLALGIPFTPIAALMISAMLVQGIQPGPLLITQHPEIFWGLIASAYIGNVMLLALNIPMVGVWVSLLRIPHYLFIPLLLVLSVIGTYSVRNSIFDVWVLLAAGIVGYAFNKMKFQLAPLVVGLILGPNIEKHFREALFLSQGDLWIYVESPIAITVWLLVAAILIAGFHRAPPRRFRRRHGAGKQPLATQSRLRQHLAALAEQRIHLGALVFQQSRLRRLDHLVQLVGVAEPGHRDVVGAGLVEIVDVGQQLRGRDDLGGRVERADVPDQLFVVGALQQRVRDAEDDQFGLADARMHQRIHIADVAIDHVHAAVRQRPEHQRIEIDHA